MATRLLSRTKAVDAWEVYQREEVKSKSSSKLFLTEEEALSLIKGRIITNPIDHYNYLDY